MFCIEPTIAIITIICNTLKKALYSPSPCRKTMADWVLHSWSSRGVFADVDMAIENTDRGAVRKKDGATAERRNGLIIMALRLF